MHEKRRRRRHALHPNPPCRVRACVRAWGRTTSTRHPPSQDELQRSRCQPPALHRLHQSTSLMRTVCLVLGRRRPSMELHLPFHSFHGPCQPVHGRTRDAQRPSCCTCRSRTSCCTTFHRRVPVSYDRIDRPAILSRSVVVNGMCAARLIECHIQYIEKKRFYLFGSRQQHKEKRLESLTVCAD